MFWDISIVYMHSANYAKAADTIRYDTIAIRLSSRWSNYWNHMFELLKVEKIIIFSKKNCVFELLERPNY